MLQKTNEESLKKFRQADNCRKLIYILRGQIARGEPDTNLDAFRQPCGTQYCLLGEYMSEPYLERGFCLSIRVYGANTTLARKLENIAFHEFCWTVDTKSEFGFGEANNGMPDTAWLLVFGDCENAGGRLSRIAELEGHINRLEAEAVCEH